MNERKLSELLRERADNMERGPDGPCGAMAEAPGDSIRRTERWRAMAETWREAAEVAASFERRVSAAPPTVVSEVLEEATRLAVQEIAVTGLSLRPRRLLVRAAALVMLAVSAVQWERLEER